MVLSIIIIIITIIIITTTIMIIIIIIILIIYIDQARGASFEGAAAATDARCRASRPSVGDER